MRLHEVPRHFSSDGFENLKKKFLENEAGISGGTILKLCNIPDHLRKTQVRTDANTENLSI